MVKDDILFLQSQIISLPSSNIIPIIKCDLGKDLVTTTSTTDSRLFRQAKEQNNGKSSELALLCLQFISDGSTEKNNM